MALGLDGNEVIRWAVVRLEDLAARSRRRAAEGDPVFAATVAAGHADLYEADARWLREHYPDAWSAFTNMH